jgi:hypothetical protein
LSGGLGVGLEATGQVGLERRLVAFRVQWRLAAFWRGQDDFRFGIEKGVVGRRQLFEPEAGFAASVAEGVVGTFILRFLVSVGCMAGSVGTLGYN